MLNRPVNSTLIALLYPLFALFIVALSSCGTIEPNAVAQPARNQPLQKQPAAEVTAKDLIAKAQQKKSPERDHLLLQAAQLSQGKADRVRNLLNEIDSTKLSEPAFATYSELQASVELNSGNLDGARRILTNQRLERQLNALDVEQEARLREARAQVFERSGQLSDSVSERIGLSALLTDSSATNLNQEALWRTLLSMPLGELQNQAARSGGIAQGWYSLAALSKNNTQDLEGQQAQLSQWLKQWKNHPANGNLPKDLSLLQHMINQQPKNIALLLPLQGRLGEAGAAVSDGFFAAYYQAISTSANTSSGQRQVPVIRQYDTSKGAMIAYQQALAEGADIIIGPLDKEDVNQISRATPFSVPLLSLNYVSLSDPQPKPESKPAPANFYQFGLAVEDEARQVARQAIQDGHKSALVVAPKQEVSERSVQAFNDEWLKLGGTLVNRIVFTDQAFFSEALRSTLLVDDSSARMTQLKQQLGTKFEFTPRRREDIDMIFLAVTPSQGRLIKPTLAFHYASAIPVYATSTIYSGEVDAANNEDLNGVLFSTIPWLFDNNNPEKQAIAQHTKSSAVYSRLHALGADAFHLYARLPQMQQAPQMRLYGATGSLHLLADGRIEREQVWARFHEGVAQPMVTVVNSDASTESK